MKVLKKEDFWDKRYGFIKPELIDIKSFKKKSRYIDTKFLELIGDVYEKDVLEIACGNGAMAVYLAKMGAKVTAIDFSKNAIENTKRLAAFNNVSPSVNIIELNTLEVKKLNKHFDLVIGKFILHHIEPFNKFCEELFDVLHKNGRGIFLENSSRNAILMFFRKYIIERFGIPKYGDKDEYPFELRELKLLEKKFAFVKTHYPELIFFNMLNFYIFRDRQKFKSVRLCFKTLDNLLYQYMPWLRKYSYWQIIELRKT